jgi:CRP/FNR family cyclic AMP-dependent transcriptional regulator
MRKMITLTDELAVIPFLRHLGLDTLNLLAANAEVLTLKRGESFYQAGGKTEHLYLLIEGRVKLCTYAKDGREMLKDVVTPGEMFGEGLLMEEKLRTEVSESLDRKTRAIMLNAETFRHVMERDFSLALQVESLIFERIRRIESRIEALTFKNSKARILAFLEQTARLRCNPLTEECLLSPFLTHQDIARLTDTSRQTVTVVLNELRKGDLIQLRRKGIYIPSHSRLLGRLETQLSA